MIKKRHIIINAGHYDNPNTPHYEDSGARANGLFEAELTKEIRNHLVLLLKDKGFVVDVVPDDLDLKQSIAWVNHKVKGLNDALALAIHFNSGTYTGKGAETYYYGKNKNSRTIATKLINKYCEVTGFYNRGAKSDTQARYGRLGWIRNTKCWATLIECVFINNSIDMKMVMANKPLLAKGIFRGIMEIYGENNPIIDDTLKRAKRLGELERKKITILQALIKAYTSLIGLLRKRGAK